jgi:DNA-binding Lrp family transcriptional regulator
VDGRQPDRDDQTELTRRVLHALEADGRLTAAQLARVVGAGEAEVTQVIAACERARIIRGYKAVVAWERVAPPTERVVAFIDVGVAPQRGFGFDQVAARIYRYPEVRSVHLVSGSSDLRVVVEGDSLHSIAAFVSEKLAVVDGVRATDTHFLLKTYKDGGEILVEDTPPDDRLPVAP